MMETHYPIFQKPIMCQCCKQYTTTPIWVPHHIGRHTMQYAFCNLACANTYYKGKAGGYEL
jgi:hypothetical protein